MQHFLAQYRPVLEAYMTTFLDRKAKEYKQVNRLVGDALSRLKKFSTQGKLLRGALVLFAYTLEKNKNITPVLPVAAAIELAHSGLLIHDDIMDRDQLRRGKPNIHTQYQAQAEKKKQHNAAHFGISQAICLGDICFFLANELLNNTLCDHQSKSTLFGSFSTEMTQVGFAQMQDVAGIHYGSKKLEDILQLYRYKTGRYTFSLPLKLGAVLGGVDRALIEKLEYFGQELGTAFQIHDDFLGVFGDQKKLGKNVSSDIRERKMTLLLFLLMKSIKDAKEKKILEQYITATEVDNRMIASITELMKKYNIHTQTLQQVRAFTTSAQDILEGLTLPKEHKQTLHLLIEQLLNRQT